MVVDEAWRYLRDPVVLGRQTEAARTWRKRNAALILATQSVTDITETAGAAPLLESMPTRLFLANPDSPEAGQATFQLNDDELHTVRELEPKRELYLWRPTTAVVLRLAVDPESSDGSAVARRGVRLPVGRGVGGRLPPCCGVPLGSTRYCRSGSTCPVERNRAGRAPARRVAQACVARNRSRPVLRQDPELVPAPEHRMRGDHLAAVPHLQPSVAPAYLHRLPDQHERHRVAVRVHAHQVVGRHHPRQRRLEPERPARRRRHQRVTLPREALHRPLVRRPPSPSSPATCSWRSRSSRNRRPARKFRPRSPRTP